MTFIDQGRGDERITYLIPFRQRFLDVVFILSRAHNQSLTYDDTKAILEAFWLQCTESGWRAWVGYIRNNGDDRTLGRADLRRRPQERK